VSFRGWITMPVFCRKDSKALCLSSNSSILCVFLHPIWMNSSWFVSLPSRQPYRRGRQARRMKNGLVWSLVRFWRLFMRKFKPAMISSICICMARFSPVWFNTVFNLFKKKTGQPKKADISKGFLRKGYILSLLPCG